MIETMRNRLTNIGVVCFVGALAGCSGGGGDGGTKTCTLIGCVDQFSASVRRADGAFPSGTHRVEVLADGASLSCTFTFPSETASSAGYVYAACPAGLMVSVSPEVVCTDVRSDGAVSHQCEPVLGRFIESISLTGTPAQVHAWQYVDDAAILDVAAAPSYEESRPNGPGCAPVCRQASVAWTLN
jgi:hypothetical protein